MKNICKLLLAALTLPMLWACSDNDYQASVTELRLVRVTPVNVNSGDMATILGRNFSTTPEENIVMIGNVQATVIEAKKDELQIIMPENEPGKYSISVKCPSGELTNLEITYLKKADHDYLVQTIAGSGQASASEGVGRDAAMRLPTSLSWAPDSTLWILGRGEQRIYQLNPSDLYVSIVADMTADGNTIWQGDFNSKGEFFYVNKDQNVVKKYDPVTKKGTIYAEGFKAPMNLCFDKNDNMFVASRDNKRVYKIDPNGNMTLYADLKDAGGGSNLNYVAADKDGNVFACVNYILWMIKPDGTKVSVCGDGQNPGSAYNDGLDGEPGDAASAKFGAAFGLACMSNGNLVYADHNLNVLRILKRGEDGTYEHGTWETVAGNGTKGITDGIGLKATFNNVYDIKVTADCRTIYVVQPSQNIVRRITIK